MNARSSPFATPGRVLVASFLLSQSAGADGAGAGAPAKSQSSQLAPKAKLSSLEVSLIEEALQHFSLEEDPQPQGKRVEAIQVYVLDVFDDRDPIPNFLNVFHSSTKHWVIKKEVLQKVGHDWDGELILETERNLRALYQLSLANVVATRGSTDDQVSLLVIVKDVWSLRPNTDWGYGTNGLDYFLFNPMENNLGGIRASLGARFLLERDSYSIGGEFVYPRMFGSVYSLGLAAGVSKNRDTGANEGGYGTFSFRRPLLSRQTKWAYGATAQLHFEKSRFYKDGLIEIIPIENNAGELEGVPHVFDTESMVATYWAVRSFGRKTKYDLGFGIELNHRKYQSDAGELFSPEVASEYESTVLPVSDTRINPYLKLSSYGSRYHRVLNIESLGLQEDYRLGLGISSTVFVGSDQLGSTRDYVGSTASAAYTFPIADGMVRASVYNRIIVANQGRHEAFASARLRVISPNVGIGHLHLDGYLGYRYFNYLNVNGFRLGGDNRLRGYGTSAAVGTNVVATNAEFRTDSVDILSAQVGLAAFYDLGAADDNFSELKLLHGLGAGVRILFPQAERTVMRLDLAFPLSSHLSAAPAAFYFTFGQAFSMPDASGGGSPY